MAAPTLTPAAALTPAKLALALGLPRPTDEQAAVIAAPPAPALVVAGAGAGKTETMAARVVWLVATGAVRPEQVLGLTFTRKAAQQLADRVHSRLRRLAGSPLLDELDPTGERRASLVGEAGIPTVLTYHAYAGRLVAEHALRLPAEPGVRLLTETAAWQLAHRVVSTWSDDLDVELQPATVTERVLALAGELGEHLLDPETLTAPTEAFCAAVESAPPGPRQQAKLADKYLRMVAAQRLRLELLPLVEAYQERKRTERAVDFADQMAIAARLADGHPEVGAVERERYRAVLLDEYQDTGHAQRVLLRALFSDGDVPVTAVGDPCQSIYGWRGASAANLPRFRTDFPVPDGEPASQFGLLTSFRNAPRVLALANAVSAPLRSGFESAGVTVDELRPVEGALAGDVRLAVTPDILTELDWVADALAARWHAALDRGDPPPTAAVLVRRRAGMAAIAAALRARRVPVEVVGLGGLLDEPEVRDLVSALRLVADPLAGTAAVRLLTGARWRLGVADLAALWRRARELAATPAGARLPDDQRNRWAVLSPESAVRSAVADAVALAQNAVPGEHAQQAGLVDALDDPGPAAAYSPAGHTRIRRLADELAQLRRRVAWAAGGTTLPDLVADAERLLLLDAETTARPGPASRAHLDAFADVVAEFAAGAEVASLPALLAYLDAAEQAEDGFAPGEVDVATDRVQILTVHAAKGLEWQLVAVPHLVTGTFPGKRVSGEWLTNAAELPVALRGDAPDLPQLELPAGDRKEVTAALDAHNAALDDRRLAEERRLLYVALTRAEHTLLISGHWWGATAARPCGPSAFLEELREVCQAGAGVVEQWADKPADDDVNPVTADPPTASWPADPLGLRREGVARGAELVRVALTGQASLPITDPEGWAADTEVLLAERSEASARLASVALPSQLSVSQLVELAADPAALAARLRRPLPFAPNPHARRGTAFHAWLEQRFGASRLLDLDELPGAADDGAACDTELTALQQAFLASEWAERRPVDVEVPFETQVDGVGVRGRMDAVFGDPDGGFTVVDWKTGALPEPGKLPALSIQLAAYRLAWAALRGCELSDVRAAFHYVGQNVTLTPDDLLDADGLRALLRQVPVGSSE
ncbi:MAG: UvrD-helicase domain-containing protein [Pseudonocardia sp.]